MTNLHLLGVIFLGITLTGFYLAYLYGRKTKIFVWKEYIAILIWPTLLVLTLAYFIDKNIIILFLISSIIGFCLEYLLGLTYHKTLNKRLWRYDKFSVKGYTSWLTLPIWGIAGVIFWFLSKIAGL